MPSNVSTIGLEEQLAPPTVRNEHKGTATIVASDCELTWESRLHLPDLYFREPTRHFSVVSGPVFIGDNATTTPATESQILAGFLKSLYDHSAWHEIGEGSLLVVKHIDRLLREEEFKQVDRVLLFADVSRLDAEIAFSFLPITATARPLLDSEIRDDFTDRVRNRLLVGRTEQYVDELLLRYR